MSKSKIVLVFLVCMFTNVGIVNADVGLDMAADANDKAALNDVGKDMGQASDMGEAVKRTTPLDPDFQPKVTSESECFCGSIQTESKTHWSLLLFLGLVFGWVKKGRR